MNEKDRTYRAWYEMHRRCRDPQAINYAYYGGRGITVCDRWKTYDTFLQDMGPVPLGLTLDRIDVDKNYEPGNCRWASRSAQQRNKRLKIKFDAKGIRDLAHEHGMTYPQLYGRLIQRSWSLEDALLTPIGMPRGTRLPPIFSVTCQHKNIF